MSTTGTAQPPASPPPAAVPPPERLSGGRTAPERRNPYVGPRAFRTGEALYGRSRETDELFDLLVARRIVLLYAPSGAGKSSLVQAGLIPRLRAEGFTDLPVIRVNLTPEAGTPNRYLASLLASLQARPADATHATAAPQPAPAASPESARAPAPTPAQPLGFNDWLAAQEPGLPGSPVLIFDQFEEIFTVDPTDMEAKRAFFAGVGAGLQKQNRWALFVMREEFIGALEPFLRYLPTRLAATMRLDLLGAAAAREAIQQPAGSVMEDAAVDALIADLRVVRVQQPDGSFQSRLGPHIEPAHLQVVCYRLWEQPRADPNRITVADVTAAASGAGAVDSALAGYYADQVASVAARFALSERHIREWFDRRLITPQGVRALVLREPEGAPVEEGHLPDSVIRALVDAHLVRAEERRGVTWYELAHDRLIEPVRRDNHDWAETHLQLLQRAANLWNEQLRHDAYLLSDKNLEEAEQWAAAHPTELSALDRDFLRESRQVANVLQSERERERRDYELDAAKRIADSERSARRRQTVLSVALAVLALLALAAFGYSLLQTEEANHQRDDALRAQATAAADRAAAQVSSREAEAQRDAAQKANAQAQAQQTLALARELAVNASLQLDGDSELSALLALESLKLAYTPEADSVAWQAASMTYVRLTLNPGMPVDKALYSPDGKRVLTFGRAPVQQGRVANPIVWDAESGKTLFQLVGHKLEILDGAWSPDGARIATASADNTAIIWEAASGRPLRQLVSSRLDAVRIVWSHDGRRLATVDQSGGVTLWNEADGKELVLLRHAAPVHDIAWAPGDRLLAAVGDDRLVHIWDTATGRSLRVLQGHSDSIQLVAWSADGTLLATGSSDATARIWNLELQRPVAVLPNHSGAVSSLAWHPKEQLLATGDRSGMLRLWRAPGGEQVREFQSHWDVVRSIQFSPDGARLATGSEDSTARIWQVSTGLEIIRLRGHHGDVTGARFSPDGNRLLSSSADNTARIWDVSRPAWVTIPLGSTLRTLSWSGDGVHLAIALNDRIVIGNLDSNLPEGQTRTGVSVTALAFNPKDQRLAFSTASQNDSALGFVATWDIVTGKEVQMSPEHERDATALAWSPDGKRLASGAADETVRIWDAASGKQLLLIKALETPTALAWSGDGRFLAAALRGVVRVWDAQSGRVLRDFSGVPPAIWQIAFSPDSRLLLMPAANRSARVYDVESGALRLEVRMGDDITNAVWNPNGSQFATGSVEGTIRLWDATNGAVQRDLLVLRQGVFSIAYSPDGKFLATAHNDEVLRFFQPNLNEMIATVRARVNRELTCAERVRYLHVELTCPK